MSTFFVENSGESTKEKFKKKQMFKIISRSNMKNLTNFNYAEKRLYGRVNRLFQPIVPNENLITMEGLNTSTLEPVMAYSFVVDAFYELQNKFKFKSMSGEIRTGEKFLTDIVPVSGYQNPNTLYDNYTKAFSNAIGGLISDNDLVFASFEQFINVIMPYIENFIKVKPVTFPAFVKSKECPMNVNGLVIEIARIDVNNDKEKYDNFYNSPNWEFYLNTCNAYGFMVDCNMPHRLVADINSVAMLTKMKSKNISVDTADKFISNCYTTADSMYFDKFVSFLYSTYSYNKPRKIVSTVHNRYDGSRTIIKKTVNYSYEEFISQISKQRLLELYIKIRFMEEESNFSEYEKVTISRNTIQLSKLGSLNEAIDIFEKIINKTFDYSGSLSYIERRKKILGR